MELRDQETAQGFIASGLCLGRVRAGNAAEIAEVAQWVEALLGERPTLPPPAVVADVGRMLLGVMPETRLPIACDDTRLREAVRAYEDNVLGRLSLEPLRQSMDDALARLDPKVRPPALAAVIAQWLARMDVRGAALSPAVLRRLQRRSATEVEAQGKSGLAGSPAVIATLAEGYEELVRAARRQPALLHPSDVFLVENFVALRTMAQRIGCAQALDAARAISETLPRRLRRRRPLQTGFTPLATEDESEYPTGGFSGITTSGTLENLVSSELIYMDDDAPAAKEATGIDIFDVRYVEAELLYYSRDEAILARRRRSYVFVFEPSLTDARFKDLSLVYQRTVLLIGMLLCAVQRLTDQLGEEELWFSFLFLPDASGKTPLNEEMELLALLMHEQIELGRAEVRVAAADDLATSIDARLRRGVVDLMVVGNQRPALPMLSTAAEARVRTLTLALAQPLPELAHHGEAVIDASGEATLLASWIETARALIENLL